MISIVNQEQDENSKLAPNLNFDIISDPSSLYALKKEWGELYDKAEKPYFTQSFEWNWCCWQAALKSQSTQRLCCLVIRCEGEAVLIWPLVISRGSYFLSVARPLAVIATEYSDMLVDATKDSKVLMQLAWQKLLTHPSFDRIELPNTREDSCLYQIVKSANGSILESRGAPWVTWENYPDWDSYYQSLSIKLRQNVSRRLRRLAELGVVRFEMLGKGDAYQETLQWLIQTKQNWVAAKDKAWSPFTSSYVDFLFSIIDYGGESGQVQILVLKLNDKPIAAKLLRIDRTRVEFVITVYDPEYSKYSPSQLIYCHSLEWAFEHRLMVDMRIGDADHKRDWTTGKCEVIEYELYCSGFGKAFFLLRSVYHKIKMLAENCKKALVVFSGSQKIS